MLSFHVDADKLLLLQGLLSKGSGFRGSAVPRFRGSTVPLNLADQFWSFKAKLF